MPTNGGTYYTNDDAAQGIVGTGVNRVVGTNFDYANNKILVTTEYADYRVLTNYNNVTAPYNTVFFEEVDFFF